MIVNNLSVLPIVCSQFAASDAWNYMVDTCPLPLNIKVCGLTAITMGGTFAVSIVNNLSAASVAWWI
jgi:hypothetical protein